MGEPVEQIPTLNSEESKGLRLEGGLRRVRPGHITLWRSVAARGWFTWEGSRERSGAETKNPHLDFMKKVSLLLTTFVFVPFFTYAAATGGTSSGGSAGTAAGAVAPRTATPAPNTVPPSVRPPLTPGTPGVFTRGGTNAFQGATNSMSFGTNFFGTNQFGTNFSSLSPLLGTLQNNIQQLLPVLASFTSERVAGAFPATNAASAATLSAITAAVSAVNGAIPQQAGQPNANFGQNFAVNSSGRSSANFGQNFATSVGTTPQQNVPGSPAGVVAQPVVPSPTGPPTAVGAVPGRAPSATAGATVEASANEQTLGLLISLQNDLQHASALLSSLSGPNGASAGILIPNSTTSTPIQSNP